MKEADKSLIRVEADELTYPLHIILRCAPLSGLPSLQAIGESDCSMSVYAWSAEPQEKFAWLRCMLGLHALSSSGEGVLRQNLVHAGTDACRVSACPAEAIDYCGQSAVDLALLMAWLS